MARLFVAVWPPAEVLDRVEALERPEVAGLRWTDRSQWHVTLRFLGRADVDAARRALARATLGGPAPAGAVLGPEVDRFGHRVLHVPVSGLEDLAGAVVAATGGVGEPPDDRPFAGHLTLARVARRARVDLRGLTGQAITGRWPASEVDLVESRLSPAGATYRVVERFALTP
ncbi:MAG: 2,3-cyclic 3-phosphodiesterase [Acidimicrobiaceae bacterium]